MIYKNLIEECIYREIVSNSIIIFGLNALEESVKVRNNKNLELIVRTRSDGGHSGNDIVHDAALKMCIENKRYTDLFIVKQKDGNYKCIIDRKEKDREKISHMNKYKVAKKFIENNGELLVKIYNSNEGSKEWNKYINELKELNPEFNYSK